MNEGLRTPASYGLWLNLLRLVPPFRGPMYSCVYIYISRIVGYLNQGSAQQ